MLFPKCQGQMKIISFIEEQVVIKQILQYLSLWETRNNDPPNPPQTARKHVVTSKILTKSPALSAVTISS